MIIRKKTDLFVAAFLCFCVTFPLPCRAMEVEAISMPSADIMLSFVMTGQVSEILVKEGAPVKNGEVLSALDDRTERIKVEELKANAEDRTGIEAAAAELDQKKVDLKKLESAHAKGAVTKWELEHSKLNVLIAELSLQAVVLEHEQNRRRLEQAIRQIERMRLTSPVSGRVEKVLVRPGESAKALDPVLQVVQIDPLWIDIPVPLAQVKQLTMGQFAPVLFPGPGSDETTQGRVIHISSVVDSASDTLRVRVEVPNPEGRPAGERVRIEFPENKQQAALGNESLTITGPKPDKPEG